MLWRNFHKHLAQSVVGVRHAHFLGHGEHVAIDRVFAVVGLDYLRQDAQYGAFPYSVGTHNCCVFTGSNTKADIEK